MAGMEEGSQEGGGEVGQRSVFFPFSLVKTTCLVTTGLFSGLIDAARDVKANDNSGYIGAAIVGGFLLVVVGWYGGQWVAKKLKKQIISDHLDT